VIQRAATASGPWSAVSDAVSTATTATVRGLINGVRVYLRVAAVSDAGQGGWSATASTVPRTTPSAPRSLTVTKGKKRGSVLARWLVPFSNGGTAITAYQVQYSKKALGPWTTKTVPASSLSLKVKSTSGKTVYLRVRAVNAAGVSAWSPVRKAKAR
jgi:hypothetical protein